MTEQTFLLYQDELEVVFSVMTDNELMILKDKVEEMIKEEAYFKVENFPLSLGGLRGLQATIMFSFWVRKGKGVKIEAGEVVVCELKESPFWQRYQKDANVFISEGEKGYESDSPEHERDIKEECGHEPEDTQYCNHEHDEEERGEWV